MMTSSWRTWSIVHQVFLFFYNVEISGSCKACSIEQISVSNIEPCPCFSCCGESRILNVFSTQRGKLIILYAFICKGTAFRSMLFVVWTLDIMHVLVSYVLVPSKPTYNLQHMLGLAGHSREALMTQMVLCKLILSRKSEMMGSVIWAAFCLDPLSKSIWDSTEIFWCRAQAEW